MIPENVEKLNREQLLTAYQAMGWTLSDNKQIYDFVVTVGNRPFLEKRLYKPLVCPRGCANSLIFLQRRPSGVFCTFSCCIRLTRHCGDEDYSILSKKPILVESAYELIDRYDQLVPLGLARRF